jgi:hypothetical protein
LGGDSVTDNERPFPESAEVAEPDWDQVNDLTACWLHEFDWLEDESSDD